jgi:hypothetical protein
LPRIALALLLFVLNLTVAWRLFSSESTGHMSSNEGMFMAISRVLVEHGFHFDWFPYWMNGIPFENTYSPLLQVLDAGLAATLHWSTARAFHFSLAAFYSIGPVLLFWFADRMSGMLRPSFLVALLYSLWSPSAIFPAVRADMGGWLAPRRLHILVAYGEGAHNVALALMPLAILFMWLAITRKQFRWDVAAGVAAGVLVLTNAFAAVDLAIVVLCLTAFYGGFRRAALIGAVAYVWISPFLTPTLIQTIRANSANAGFHLTRAAVLMDVGVFAGAVAIWWLARRKLPFDGFVLSLAWIFLAIPAAAHFLKVELLPQPERYHMEMEMAVCLALLFSARLLLKPMAVGILIGLLITQFFGYRRYARELILKADITQTLEYKTAKWIGANLPGKRVMLGGDVSFWFNAFVDNPQFDGGHDPFSPNWMQEVASYAIYSGDGAGARDAANAIAWLKAFGCHAVTVPGEGSREAYHPFRNPRKFDGVLPVLQQDAHDAIYAVPQRTESDAHVIPESAVIRHVPVNGLDIAEVNGFVSSLDDPTLPAASLTWLDRTHARIDAPVLPGQVVALQMTYDRGWAASANGQAVPIARDGIGLMTLRPACHGPCEIRLTFEGGWERRVCRWSSLLAMAAVLITAILKVWQARNRSNMSGAGIESAKKKDGGTALSSPTAPA